MLALMSLISLPAQSQVVGIDSLANDSDSTILLPSVLLDTLLGTTLNEDDILLGLVAQQSQELHANDTV